MNLQITQQAKLKIMWKLISIIIWLRAGFYCVMPMGIMRTMLMPGWKSGNIENVKVHLIQKVRMI